MPKYYARYSELQNQAEALRSIGNSLASFEGRLSSVASSMDTRDGSMASLRSQLIACARNIPNTAKRTQTLGISLDEIRRVYQKAETDTYHSISDEYSRNILALPFTISESVLQNLPGSFLGNLSSASVLSALLKPDLWKGAVSEAESAGLETGFLKWSYDSEEDESELSLFSAEAKAEVSAFEISGQSEHASGSVTIGSAEAYAEFEVTSGGVSAECGTSVTAFNAKGEIHAGDNMLGAQAKGDVTVGELSAKVGVDARILDEDGNFDPELKVSAGAEAILAEASGTLGFTILGTTFSFTGKAQAGASAKAEAGYADGKASFGAELAAGVGLGFEAEIDFSGTVEAVTNLAQSAIECVSEGVDAIAGLAESAWNAVTGWFPW